MNPGNRQPSAAALKKLHNGVKSAGRPLVFLDFDDVICINKPYGGRDILESEANTPANLWERF